MSNAIDNKAREIASIILNAAGSNLSNYMPKTQEEIIGCMRHAIKLIRRDALSETIKICKTSNSSFGAAHRIQTIIDNEVAP